MKRFTCCVCVALVNVAMPSLGGTQVARGVITDSVAQRPLPGVAVLGMDSLGATAAQTVTDSAGQYSLSIGRVRVVKFMRIGFRAREHTLTTTSDIALSLSLERIPPILDAVRVAEREVCQGGDPGATAWRMWDQARAGLTASVVARVVNPMTASTHGYRRRVSAYDRLVRRQTNDQRSGTVERPFTAAPPARLVAQGYLDEDSTGRTFHGPDVDALLHETFAATHCFRLQGADAAHRGMVGLAFQPTPARDTMVDVAGVLWFTADGTALHSLEFRYTGLEPAALKAEVGGHIGFRALGNGAVFVDRWSLRVPVMSAVVGARPPEHTSRGQSRRMSNTAVRVAELEEFGGAVATASWRDGTRWDAAVTGLSGGVRDAKDDSPIPGAVVELDGTGYRAITDRDGEFILPAVTPGRYTLVVTDSALLRFASPRRTSQVVEVGMDQLLRITPRIESSADAVGEACKGRTSARDSRVMTGRIVLPTGSAPARLRAAWPTTSTDSGRAEAPIDVDGRFLLCTAPSDLVAVRVHTGRLESDTTIDVGHTRITTVSWKPTLRPQAAGAEHRVVRGIVTDSGSRPVARANVNVPGYAGGTTDDNGAFVLRLTTRDATTIDVRRIGFAPTRFGLSRGGDTTVSVTLLAGAYQLEGFTVRAAATRSTRLAGFEDRLRRRARGAISGTFVTAAQIEQRSPTQVTQMLTNLPGIFVDRVHPSFPRYAIFARSPLLSDSGNGFKCAANVYLDGVRVHHGGMDGKEAGVAIDDLISPSLVAGIEVYRAAMDAPSEFQTLNGTCAIVIIWSKNAGAP